MLPLLDREAEVDALERAVEAVAAGAGRVVIVEGGPGAGKTRLLAEARRIGELAGLRVLSARGGEMEREYSYGGVRQLFEASLVGTEAETWLAGSATAASSVFRPETTHEATAFATLNGLYWLTANAAAEHPLAVVVDDLHWIDRPSLGFLQFLVRRLEELPVLLVLAGRPAESDVLAELAESPVAEVLNPASLTESAAAALTEEIMRVRPAERFVAACRQATGGNPLLLVELLRTLRAEAIVPDDAHVDLVDHVGPSAVQRIVLVRLRRLPAEALRVAQATAVLGSQAEGSLLGELARLEEPAVAEAIESLIGAEIIDPQPPLRFVHPIVRDAIYRELTPDDRDRHHLRAAELLRARAAEPDQVGAHLLVAAPRGLNWIVDASRAAAADAAQRGAVESAITFLRRAVAERPGDGGFDLLFRLGMTESAIDPRAAVEHLRGAQRLSADGRVSAHIGEMITRILAFIDPPAATRAARQTLADLPAGDHDRRAGLLALEHHARRFSGGEAPLYPDEVPDSARGRMLRAVQAWDLALSGGSAQECVALAADALGVDGRSAAGRDRARIPIFTAMVAGSVLIFADDRRAQTFWDEWYLQAVTGGRAQALIAAGAWHGLMHYRLGRITDAEAAIRAAMSGPRDWGPGTETVPAHTVATLAELILERGDLTGAQAALDKVPGRSTPDNEGALLCRCAEIRLLVAQGRHQDALDAGDPVLDRLQTVRNPAWTSWRSVRAEALAQVGRAAEAMALASEELELARNWGTPGPIGRALTRLGRLEGGVDLLEEAVETTRDQFARLEHAEALFALGRAVRQNRRPREARGHLRAAHDLATQCGAAALAGRARDELAAAGGRPKPTIGSGTASLTPSERRVAELAATGQTNRDIAGQLYLSLKTVEVHLSSSYRKLGIRNRGELEAALSEPVGSQAPA